MSDPGRSGSGAEASAGDRNELETNSAPEGVRSATRTPADSLLACKERLRKAEATSAALQSKVIALEGRATILLDALSQALELGPAKKGVLFVAALEQFEAWQEVSGFIGPGTSLDIEVRACLEEAFRLGVVAGLGEAGDNRPETLTADQKTRRGDLRDTLRAFRAQSDRAYQAELERGNTGLSMDHRADSDWASGVLAFGFSDSMEAIAERAGR